MAKNEDIEKKTKQVQNIKELVNEAKNYAKLLAKEIEKMKENKKYLKTALEKVNTFIRIGDEQDFGQYIASNKSGNFCGNSCGSRE
jgi:hypothetical protein